MCVIGWAKTQFRHYKSLTIMKTSIRISIVVVVLVSIACKSTFQRYASLKESEENNQLVDISILSVFVDESGKKQEYQTAFELSDRGQAALLEGKDWAESKEILNEKFLLNKKGKPKKVDLSIKRIRITFSIGLKKSFMKSNFSAYDRIEDLNYSFDISDNIDKSVKFISWNKYTTEYGARDLGSLEYNQGFTSNIGVNGELGANYSKTSSEQIDENNSNSNSTSIGPKVSATGNVGFSRSRKETRNITEKFIRLSGSFNERSFDIHQQGNGNTKLVGNVSIELTIDLPDDDVYITSFNNLFGSNYSINDPSKVTLVKTRFIIPDTEKIPEGIKGQFKYNFAVRHIQKGAKTQVEYDDKINYITGEKTVSDQVLIKKSDFETTLYTITLNDKSLEIDNSDVIHFLDFDSALEFKKWVSQTFEATNDDSKIKVSNHEISFNELSTSEVKKELEKIQIEVIKR
jgi:hypothetical protein